MHSVCGNFIEIYCTKTLDFHFPIHRIAIHSFRIFKAVSLHFGDLENLAEECSVPMMIWGKFKKKLVITSKVS